MLPEIIDRFPDSTPAEAILLTACNICARIPPTPGWHRPRSTSNNLASPYNQHTTFPVKHSPTPKNSLSAEYSDGSDLIQLWTTATHCLSLHYNNNQSLVACISHSHWLWCYYHSTSAFIATSLNVVKATLVSGHCVVDRGHLRPLLHFADDWLLTVLQLQLENLTDIVIGIWRDMVRAKHH